AFADRHSAWNHGGHTLRLTLRFGPAAPGREMIASKLCDRWRGTVLVVVHRYPLAPRTARRGAPQALDILKLADSLAAGAAFTKSGHAQIRIAGRAAPLCAKPRGRFENPLEGPQAGGP